MTSRSDEWDRLVIVREILCTRTSSACLEVGLAEMDDAAIVGQPGGESLAIASDFVRGSGFTLFKLGLLTYYNVGYFLVVANLSDMAAMGAHPQYLTTVVRYNENMTDEEFAEVFRGIRAAADEYHTVVVGGNTGSYGMDVFAATAVGSVPKGRALLRREATVDDLLCVTGVVGRAVTALVYFGQLRASGRQLPEARENELLAAWRRPVARVSEGQMLVRERLATACQDISDGLKGTVEQLAAASSVGFELYADQIPLHDLACEIATASGADPLALAASASVDFELLFTIRPKDVERCVSAFQKHGTRISIIGRAVAPREVVLVDGNGQRRALPGFAWRHQGGDVVSAVLAALRPAGSATSEELET